MLTRPLDSIQFDALLSCAIEDLVSLLVYWLNWEDSTARLWRQQDGNMLEQKVDSELSADEDTARRAIRRSRWED